MKLAINRFLSVFFVLFLCSFTLFAQDKQQQNNAVFEQVRALVEKQDAAGIYALTTEEFKSHIGWVNFENFTKFGIFSQGAMSSYSLLEFDNNISNYKISFPSGDFSLKLSTDSAGKISYLLFKKIVTTIASTKKNLYKANLELTGIEKYIDDVATEYVNRSNTVGLAIGFLQKGVMRSFAYGETEKGSAELPGSHAAFEIGSITKTFTATLLAWYANEKKVSLNDPITKFLPDSVKKNKQLQGITLLMLANHTSGLARIPDNIAISGKDALNPYKNYDRKKLYAYLKRCKLDAPPGTKLSYSNTAAGLLGTILEKVSGKPYAQMVEDIIAAPLKMECTGIKFHGDHIPHIIPVYNEKAQPTPIWEFDALAGAGALRSNSTDLLRFAEANLDLNTSALGKALALTQKITFDKETTIGLGWFKKTIGKHTVFWHNGATFGSSSFIAFIPGKGIALSVLSNSAEPVDGIAEKILLAIE